jgi:hypothetical protein
MGMRKTRSSVPLSDYGAYEPEYLEEAASALDSWIRRISHWSKPILTPIPTAWTSELVKSLKLMVGGIGIEPVTPSM